MRKKTYLAKIALLLSLVALFAVGCSKPARVSVKSQRPHHDEAVVFPGSNPRPVTRTVEPANSKPVTRGRYLDTLDRNVTPISDVSKQVQEIARNYQRGEVSTDAAISLINGAIEMFKSSRVELEALLPANDDLRRTNQQAIEIIKLMESEAGKVKKAILDKDPAVANLAAQSLNDLADRLKGVAPKAL